MKKSLITVHTVYKQFLPKLKPKSKVYNYKTKESCYSTVCTGRFLFYAYYIINLIPTLTSAQVLKILSNNCTVESEFYNLPFYDHLLFTTTLSGTDDLQLKYFPALLHFSLVLLLFRTISNADQQHCQQFCHIFKLFHKRILFLICE